MTGSSSAHVSARSPEASVSSRSSRSPTSALHGALGDLYRATIGYNLQYSAETYGGPAHAIRYLAGLPLERARVDGLWFAGGLGALCLVAAVRRPAAQVTLVWLAASVLSIAINGSRGLPQYFVQAAPALALAAAAWPHIGMGPRYGLEDRADPHRAGGSLARRRRAGPCLAAPPVWRSGADRQHRVRCELLERPDQPDGLSRALRRHGRRREVLGARGRRPGRSGPAGDAADGSHLRVRFCVGRSVCEEPALERVTVLLEPAGGDRVRGGHARLRLGRAVGGSRAPASCHRGLAEARLEDWRGARAELDRVLPRPPGAARVARIAGTNRSRTAWSLRSGGADHDALRGVACSRFRCSS